MGKKCKSCGKYMIDKRYANCLSCEVEDFNMRMKEVVSEQCSNCHYWNSYSKAKYKGRKKTYCISCGHVLTICPDPRFIRGLT